MQSIFEITYLLLFFSYILVAMFIVFHIFRYSLNRGLALFGGILFSIVFLILLFTNFQFFTALPINAIFTHSF